MSTAVPPPPTERITRLNEVPLSLALGSYRSDVLNWGYIGPVPWRNYLHTHSCFEVCYAFAGRGTFRICNRDYTVRVGDAFVARPQEPHEIISSPDQPLGICFWAYTLLPSHGAPASEVDPLLQAFRAGGPWVSCRSEGIALAVSLLEREITTRDAGSAEAIGALTLALLLDTARAFVSHRIPPGELVAPRLTPAQLTVERIIRYLHDNQARSLTVRDVAAEVNLSERHTNRLFRARMGVPIMEYLTGLRIETASRLLLELRMPVKEVARAVGFADVHYFTTLFHARTGLPPATFRARSGTRQVQSPG